MYALARQLNFLDLGGFRSHDVIALALADCAKGLIEICRRGNAQVKIITRLHVFVPINAICE